MPQRKRGLQGVVRDEARAGAEHPLADREGRDEDALSIPIHRIQPDPEQPRKHFDESSLAELARSIGEHGVLQPLIVRSEGNTYYIVAGERRFRAAHMAKLEVVPARVVHDQERVLEIQLVENLQREDLPLLEEAQALHNLQELMQVSVRGLEQATGKSKSYIARRLGLLKLPGDVKDMLDRAPHLFSQAEKLGKIADTNRRQRRIAALLQDPELGGLGQPRQPGRPSKPFFFKRRRSGAFDLVVKYRPGETDRETLIAQLKQALSDLES